jgi:hypothetical protein
LAAVVDEVGTEVGVLDGGTVDDAALPGAPPGVDAVGAAGVVTLGAGTAVVLVSLLICCAGAGLLLWRLATMMPTPTTRMSTTRPGQNQRRRLFGSGPAARAARATFFDCDALPMRSPT